MNSWWGCHALGSLSSVTLRTGYFLAETLRARLHGFVTRGSGSSWASFSPVQYGSCFLALGCVAMLDHYKLLAEKACLMPWKVSCFLSYNLLSKLVSGWCGSEFKCSCMLWRPLVGVSLFISEMVTVMRGKGSDWLEQPEVICCAAEQRDLELLHWMYRAESEAGVAVLKL